MKKVRVWQVGYTTCKDWVLRNNANAECKEMGYVMVEDDDKYWRDTVWHLLNWSCWTRQKPENVFSPLTFCNSDIILKKENSSRYYSAAHCGWESSTNLNTSICNVKYGHHNIWPFADVKCISGTYFAKNGKAYIEKENGECEEINF